MHSLSNLGGKQPSLLVKYAVKCQRKCGKCKREGKEYKVYFRVFNEDIGL